MALIKCPECGRNNVSDTAESCPNCGYGVKAHFERIKKQQHQKMTSSSIDSKIKSTEEEKFNQYQYEIKQQQQEIDNLERPKKTNFLSIIFRKQVRWPSCLILIGPTITLLFYKITDSYSIFLLLYIVLGYLVTPFWLFIGYGNYKRHVEDYKRDLYLYETNKAEWEREKERRKKWIEESYRTRAHFEAEAAHRPPVTTQTSKIICPVCGSHNVERITTIDRGFSVAMVGLASGKIGKQYKCKNCKHMW